jgi:hypothetical protein
LWRHPSSQDHSDDVETHKYRQLIEGIMRAACTSGKDGNRKKYFNGAMPYSSDGGPIPLDKGFEHDMNAKVKEQKQVILKRLADEFSQ